MTQATIDIILVSYNTAEYNLRALQSIYDETHSINFHITVVDNNSQDNSTPLIRTQFPEVTLVNSACNLGFARGVNLGASYSNSGDYVLLLNPDTVILDQAIEKLVNFAKKNPKNGIWGGITLNDDLSINTHNAWAEENISSLFFSIFGLNRVFKRSCLFNKANYGCWKRDSIKTVDTLQGSFFLTSRKLWDKLEGLDETFFMYAEEADYCYRARQLGYQPIITPEAKIIHHGGVSEANLSNKMIKLLTGKVTFINKHHNTLQQLIMKGLLVTYVLSKLTSTLLFSLIKTKKRVLVAQWWKTLQKTPEWIQGYH